MVKSHTDCYARGISKKLHTFDRTVEETSSKNVAMLRKGMPSFQKWEEFFSRFNNKK